MPMKRTCVLVLFLAAVSIVFTGCKAFPRERDNGQSLSLSLLPEERSQLKKPGLEWGLCLSGGGLRSSEYSMGVLKALYDANLLPRFDAISTVSGGGYAAYMVYANDV